MPSVSQAQNAAMHAAAEGRSNIGIPASVGKEFVKADAGRKVGQLPEHKDGGHAAAVKRHMENDVRNQHAEGHHEMG